MKSPMIDSSVGAKLATLKAASDHFNSDLTEVICRDANEKLLSVSVYAKGEHAVALERWLKRRGRRDAG